MSYKICVVASVHPDFDARIWKQVTSLAEAGHEVHVVSTWNPKNADYLPNNVYFHSFKREQSLRKRLFLHPLRIWKLISSMRFDVFHFHEFEMLPFMVFFKLLYRRPVIYDIHENHHVEMAARGPVPNWLRPLAGHVTYWLEWLLAAIIHNLVVVVPLQERHFSGSLFNRIRINNYATVKLTRGRTDDYDQRSEIIIFTGSMGIENGALALLEIARILKKIRPQAKFLVSDRFGNQGVFRDFFMSRLSEYGLSDSIMIVPNVLPAGIMQHLNRGRVAIIPLPNMPQASEGLPTRIFEYMAAGLPVVASRTLNLAEVIEKHGIGFCASLENNEEFAHHIAYLLDNHNEAKRMGEKGMQVFQEEYSWEKEAEKLVSFYEQILKADGGKNA